MTRFERTIEFHLGDLRRYARVLLGSAGEAEDLVQECLLRALSRRKFWRSIRDPRAYLFTILHHVFIDSLPSRRRRLAEIQLDRVNGGLSYSESQLLSVELRELSRAIAMLPTEQREIVLLVGFDGMSYQHVAEILDIPLGTVMSRLSRGREALRQLTNGTGTKSMAAAAPAGKVASIPRLRVV
jgi:RNA polymerase sigma-70 factor, ECF subfamily